MKKGIYEFDITLFSEKEREEYHIQGCIFANSFTKAVKRLESQYDIDEIIRMKLHHVEESYIYEFEGVFNDFIIHEDEIKSLH